MFFRSLAAVLILSSLTSVGLAQAKRVNAPEMSPMGQLAQRWIKNPNDPLFVRARLGTNGGDPVDALESVVVGGQAETSVAVDSTGDHVVVGFNDTRGFSLSPISVSGWMYSDDGGATFTDGGQLPSVSTAQVFGDPEIHYLGGTTFVYFSIFVTTGGIQSMCLHRSTDNGHTWSGPYEITPATISGHAADKEFCTVDPDTGRVMMAWADFNGPAIKTTYSDDVTSATPPTWSSAVTVASAVSGNQAPCPRFDTGTTNAYVVFRKGTGSWGQEVAFSKSTDNGATWSSPVNINPSTFLTMDMVPGNDRSNTSPSMAVDNSGGSSDGNIYVVYVNNASVDGGDIAFQKSTDSGGTFTAPVMLGSAPGSDRAQWFPWVDVDDSTGRVWVSYYDQDVNTTGDMTQYMAQYSDDGGATFTDPFPVSDRPFHAGFGNDTGQPNLGDYNQSADRNGEQFFSFAYTPATILYTEGQPTSASMNWPESTVRVLTGSKLPVRLGDVTANDFFADGNLDPDERADLFFNLVAYKSAVTGLSATLSSSTPGVTILQGSSSYPDISAGGTLPNNAPFAIKTTPAFVPGTDIVLQLDVTGTGGNTSLLYNLHTGTPSSTTVLSEDFNGVSAGSLPAGWTTSHAGGTNTVAWTTSNTAFSTSSNGLFHSNLATAVRFERVFTPTVTIPATSDWVTLDFDITYNLEDEPTFDVFAWDGMCLRVTDLTSGALLRSVLAESFAEVFTTGSNLHYPKHLPRSSNTSYFQDMSVWSGWSGGTQHVHMRFRGMEGRDIQLRWEYTEDNLTFGSASAPVGTTAGVLVDNIVLKAVEATYGPFSIDAMPPTVYGGRDTMGRVRMSSLAPAGGTDVSVMSNSGLGTFGITPTTLVNIPEGAFSANFPVHIAPVDADTSITLSATLGAESDTVTITVKRAVLRSLEFGSSTVKPGQNPAARITLFGLAGPSGLTASLSSDNPAATVPATAIVAPGKGTKPFPVTLNGVDSTTVANIEANMNGVIKSARLTIEPAELTAVDLAVSATTGGTNVALNKVILDGKAGPSGVACTLISDSAAATVPAGVNIGPNKTFAVFQLKTSPVAVTTTATITAGHNGVLKTDTIDINP